MASEGSFRDYGCGRRRCQSESAGASSTTGRRSGRLANSIKIMASPCTVAEKKINVE